MTAAPQTDDPQEKGELEDAFGGDPNSGNVFDVLRTLGLPPGAQALLPGPKEEGAPQDPEAEAPEAELEVRTFQVPASTATRAEQLAFWERIVEEERARYRDAVAAADKRFVEKANLPLYVIHQDGLYLDMVSPATGAPYKTFKAYLQERWGISRAHGYRVVNEHTVRRALGDLAPEALSARQVPVLLALHRQVSKENADSGLEAAQEAGDAAVQKAWEESEAKTPNALRATIKRLGWSVEAIETTDDLSDSGEAAPSQLDRWGKAAKVFDPTKASELSAAAARELYEQLKPFVDALETVALPSGKEAKSS
ncbi:hypothetical protein [Streptomyces sp. NPDC058758]|uniref:hypothetical protein n=1 Tax=Streptomyces sp. NPDC058758 TaxID=3346627 RepID=UPI00367CB1DE